MGNETNKPDFSDVQSGSSSTAPTKADFSDVQSGSSSSADPVQTYTVVSGDSLSKIAKHFYGDANKWKAIFEANTDQLSDPNRIKPGQVLKIPANP